MVRRALGIETRELGSALVFALAALTLVAMTVLAVTAGVRSRGVGVVMEERHVRLTALSDAAMAESLAELARNPGFTGIPERRIEGGSIASTVRKVGLYEIDLEATGRRNGWRAVIVGRVDLEHGPRVLRWERTERP
ncbi:MAG: hypothetical protein ACC742_15535, partial [Thermoanaerobaculales bacterium]